MLRLKTLGWGVRRIAGELGCSHITVRRIHGTTGEAPIERFRRAEAGALRPIYSV
jgi:hypothetical protein